MALGIPLPKEFTEIPINAENLKDYVGEYQLSPTFSMTIRIDGDKLTVQATGQGVDGVLPYEGDKFFSKRVGAQIEFTRGADGKVDAMILHQGGRDMKAPRL